MEFRDEPEVKARNPNSLADELGTKGSNRLKSTSGRQHAKGPDSSGSTEHPASGSERFRTRSKRMRRQEAADRESAERSSRFKQAGRATHALRFAEETAKTGRALASSAVFDDDRDAEEQALDEARAKSRLALGAHHGRLKIGTGQTQAAARLRDKPALGKHRKGTMAVDAKGDNLFGFWKQRRWKKSARTAEATRKAAATGSTSTLKGLDAVKAAASRMFTAIAGNKAPVVIASTIVVLALVGASMAMTFMPLAAGITQAMAATSYTATDEAIKEVDAAYTQLEAGMEAQAQRAESTHPGYDEYRYQLDEIGHDPFALASILTARYGDYTPSQVNGFLSQILGNQYDLSFTPSTETVTDNETNEERTIRILTVRLTNHGLAYAASQLLNTEEMASFEVTYACKGNRDYLFPGTYTPGGPGVGFDYPADALSDAEFARMAAIIDRCIGTPYVFGGSRPGAFDCSGFVSYVLNQSGVASFGRLDCNGIMSHCSRISESQLKPGDLIFFQGTYDCPGASHIGIVVDPARGIMAHSGNPCQFASYKTPYFQAHFLAFGRLHH